MYILIHQSADGMDVESLTKKELNERFTLEDNEEEEEYNYYGQVKDQIWLNDLPEFETTGTGTWMVLPEAKDSNSLFLLIKGEIIVPKAEEIITRMSFD